MGPVRGGRGLRVAMIDDHPRQRRGMHRLVAALGRLVHRRKGFLFAQNGEDVIGPSWRHLDGWNCEDVSRTYSFRRRRYVAVSPSEHQAAVRALRRVAARGLLVTVTDYVRPGDSRARDAAISAPCAAGALPYVSDIELRRPLSSGGCRRPGRRRASVVDP